MDTLMPKGSQEMMDMAELIGLLQSGNAETRMTAAASLAGFNDQEAIDALTYALGDSDLEVAEKAAESLISIGGKELIIKLMTKMLV